MKTKLTRVGESVALLLDEPLLEELGLQADDEVEVSASGRVLIAVPAEDAERERDFRASAEKITAKYAGLFRRLSQ